jgi:hypothetical protein
MVLMSHNREASKVTIYRSYFHPAHQHYTDEAHKAETVPSVVIYIYIYDVMVNSQLHLRSRTTVPQSQKSTIYALWQESNYWYTESNSRALTTSVMKIEPSICVDKYKTIYIHYHVHIKKQINVILFHL